MLRRSSLFLVLALVGGCAKPLEVGSITEIKPSTGSTSIDVLEPRRRAGQTGVPSFAGDQLVEVRTYTNKDGNGDVEIAGASCSLSAADFSATMQSPAKVRVPLYRGQSSTLAVACEMPGYKKAMVTAAPMDVTRQGRMASGASGGVIGIVTVAAIDAMSDNSHNEWHYPVVQVTLVPNAPTKVSSAP
jgi:hypothetical protein